MIVLFIFMVVAMIAFMAFTIYNKRYTKASFAVMFFAGLSIMMFANTIYQIHMGSLSHLWIQNNRTLYDFIMNIRFSFYTTQQISLVGEIIVLLSILLTTYITLINKRLKVTSGAGFESHNITKRLWHIALYAFLTVVYFAINSPDRMYNLYLAMHSAVDSAAQRATRVYYGIYAIKVFVVSFIFIYPFFVCIYKYFTHSFSIIKRNLLLFATSILLLESLLIIFIKTEYIHSFFTLNTTIFYSNSSAALVTENAIVILLCVFIVLLAMMIVRSGLFKRNYFDLEFSSVYDSSKKLDKTLRMILHTYKNMFLAINRLSATALSVSGEEDKSHPFVASIEDISKDALYNITHLLNMLTNVEITPQLLDIREMIDIAVSKADVGDNISLSIDCPMNTYFVNSDSLYMTELIYNVYKNSCDAVEGKDDGRISVRVRIEDEWILIEISDNGCGIPKDIKKQIFKPLISNKQGTNNWGIGLYYAKKIVKAHNGYIFADSKENKYTKFEIYLPAPNSRIKNKKVVL